MINADRGALAALWATPPSPQPAFAPVEDLLATVQERLAHGHIRDLLPGWSGRHVWLQRSGGRAAFVSINVDEKLAVLAVSVGKHGDARLLPLALTVVARLSAPMVEAGRAEAVRWSVSGRGVVACAATVPDAFAGLLAAQAQVYGSMTPFERRLAGFPKDWPAAA